MREYGQIQTAIWRHHDFISLSTEGKLLVTYLLTGPHSNGIGCFYLPMGYLSADLNMVSDTLSNTLSEVIAKGFLRVCETTQYVQIPKFLKWNPIASSKVCKNRLKDVVTIPSKFKYINELKTDFDKYCTYKSDDYDTVWNRVSDRVGDTTPHPTPKIKEAAVAALSATEQKKEFFDTGIPLLTSQGKTEQQARTFLGKALSRVGPADALTIMRLARDSGDAASYIAKAAFPIKLPEDNRALWDIRLKLGLPMEYEEVADCHDEIRNVIRANPERKKVLEAYA